MKKLICILAAALSLWTLALAPAAMADSLFTGSKDVACSGTQLGDNQPCDASAPTKANNLLKFAINIISIVAGIVAIIMIIISGLRFITSGGDSNTVASAKNALIYAIVGIVIVALAQTISIFVVNKAGGAVNCPAGQHLLADGKTCG